MFILTVLYCSKMFLYKC